MIPRTLSHQLMRLKKKMPVLAVTGPRQSGKTTLCKQLFSDYFYANLEYLDVRARAESDPRGFLEPHKTTGMVIDEIQQVPQLFSYLQGVVDETGLNGRYVISGSQNFLVMEQIGQSLAGRVAIHNLFPFTLEELWGSHEPEPEHHDFSHDELHIPKEWSVDRVLYSGMYPRLHDQGILPTDYYPSYLQSYVERDVRLLKNVTDLSLFSRFLQLCAGRVGQLVNFASMGNELGIDAKTVKAWISLLEASFVIFLLPPYYKNFSKRVVKSSKLYFYDTGVVSNLLGLTSEEQLSHFYMRGQLFENFVIAEVKKTLSHRGLTRPLYFWRDSTGNEIDLIYESAGTLHGTEIKSGVTFNQSYVKSIQAFCKISHTSPEHHTLCYGGTFEGTQNGIRIVPFHKLHHLLPTN